MKAMDQDVHLPAEYAFAASPIEDQPLNVRLYFAQHFVLLDYI